MWVHIGNDTGLLLLHTDLGLLSDDQLDKLRE